MAVLRRLAIGAYALFVIFGLAVSPRVLGDLLERGEAPQASRTRDRIGERLDALAFRFEELASEAEELNFRVEKIRVGYGLSSGLAPGEPLAVEPSPFPGSIFHERVQATARIATRVRLDIGSLEAAVSELTRFEAQSPGAVVWTPSITPLTAEPVLTSPMGERTSSYTGTQEFHTGVDLSAPVGSLVVAPADGQVAFAGRFRVRRRSYWWRLGRMVALRHGDDMLTLYGHLGKIVVRRGERVSRGSSLGVVGESGVSASPHLHYSVWRRNDLGVFEPVDPRLFMFDRRWDDEAALLVEAANRPASWEYEALPRGLR
jgi:murein DD-endopeptidase MepM/ murein hydrolase activator NlpD